MAVAGLETIADPNEYKKTRQRLEEHSRYMTYVMEASFRTRERQDPCSGETAQASGSTGQKTRGQDGGDSGADASFSTTHGSEASAEHPILYGGYLRDSQNEGERQDNEASTLCRTTPYPDEESQPWCQDLVSEYKKVYAQMGIPEETWRSPPAQASTSLSKTKLSL
jgi:hypothetical protein